QRSLPTTRPSPITTICVRPPTARKRPPGLTAPEATVGTYASGSFSPGTAFSAFGTGNSSAGSAIDSANLLADRSQICRIGDGSKVSIANRLSSIKSIQATTPGIFNSATGSGSSRFHTTTKPSFGLADLGMFDLGPTKYCPSGLSRQNCQSG